MPSATSGTTAPEGKLRNRINQRNHRERRQQYTRELEEKVRATETARIEATQEVQKAARAVVAENILLREVLKRKFGADESAVNGMLEEMRTQTARPYTTSEGSQSSSTASSTTSVTASFRQNQHLNHTIRPSLSYRQPRCDPTAYAPSRNMSKSLPASVSESVPARKLESPEGNDSTMTNDCPPGGQPLGIQTSSSHLTHRGPRDYMSCEEAASILSSVRMREEETDVRAQLGCTTTGSCKVDNMALMTIMSENV